MKKHYQENKETYKARSKARYQINKATILRGNKNTALLRDFGITLEQYGDLLESQNGVCAICGSVERSGKRLAVDHGHKSGRIRGLLCGNCNRAIGLLKDDIELLHKAIRHLE